MGKFICSPSLLLSWCLWYRYNGWSSSRMTKRHVKKGRKYSGSEDHGMQCPQLPASMLLFSPFLFFMQSISSLCSRLSIASYRMGTGQKPTTFRWVISIDQEDLHGDISVTKVLDMNDNPYFSRSRCRGKAEIEHRHPRPLPSLLSPWPGTKTSWPLNKKIILQLLPTRWLGQELQDPCYVTGRIKIHVLKSQVHRDLNFHSFT